MSVTEEEVQSHWKYFLSIERDLIELKDFVEIHEDNLSTYSFEISKIIQLSCSEIDSVCRVICKLIDPESNYFDVDKYSGNITDYRSVITSEFVRFTDVEVGIPDLGITVKPWGQWKHANSPDWWRANNKVKHYRHSCFNEASLKNCLLSLADLMAIIMYLYRHVVGRTKASPNPGPQFYTSEYAHMPLAAAPDKELPDFEP